MAFPVAQGHPDYSSSGTTNRFIPEIWSGKMLLKWYSSTFLTKITNTQYEGEIKSQGDSVVIRSIPDITISDHAAGDEITYERPQAPPQTLLIDKGKRWAIKLDDVMKVQTDLPLLNKWTDDAAQQMKISIETSFLTDSAIYSGCHASNTGATAGVGSASYNMGSVSAVLGLTPQNVLDWIIDAGSVLDEQNIPEVGRFMLIPTWAAGLIKKSDIKDASLTNDSVSTLRNGRIGQIDRMTLFASNLCYHSGTSYYAAMFGIDYAITMATQLVKTEHLRSERSFDDLIRGLQIYGYKVIKTAAYGVSWVKKA